MVNFILSKPLEVLNLLLGKHTRVFVRIIMKCPTHEYTVGIKYEMFVTFQRISRLEDDQFFHEAERFLNSFGVFNVWHILYHNHVPEIIIL